MKRWWAWALGGIVVIAVVVRLSTSGKTPAEEARPGSSAVRSAPTPPTSFDLVREAQRRLQDDRLPPPPNDAPPAAWDQYRKELQAIRAGQDPLVNSKAQMELSKDMFAKRLQQRQSSAEKRMPTADEQYRQFQSQQEEAEKRTRAEMQTKIDAMHAQAPIRQAEIRGKLLQAGIDTGRPPQRIVQTPDLGAPLIDENGKPVKEIKPQQPSPDQPQ